MQKTTGAPSPRPPKPSDGVTRTRSAVRTPKVTPPFAVATALGPTKRMAFYAEMGQAEEGEPINTVLRKWWMEAMLDSRPGRGQRFAAAAAAAGRNLVLLLGLIGGGERATAANAGGPPCAWRTPPASWR